MTSLETTAKRRKATDPKGRREHFLVRFVEAACERCADLYSWIEEKLHAGHAAELAVKLSTAR